MAWWVPLAIGAGSGLLSTLGGEKNSSEKRILGRHLKNAMYGNAPSAAQEQLRAALRQGASMQHGAAAGARPGQNAALARRTAAQQATALQASAAGKAAQIRAAEQAQARAQYMQFVMGQDGQPSTYDRFLGGLQGGAELYALMNQQQQQPPPANMNWKGPPGGSGR